MKNKGLQNEYWFINAINDKSLKELNILLQDLILFLFPNITLNTKIKCYKNLYYEKGDICICVNEKIKYASIKMGIRNSVHNEKIETFVKFLKSLKIRKNTIDELLKYHYGDETVNGKGITRKSVAEYKIENIKKIEKINKEFSQKYVIKEVIKRFLIKGTQKQFHSIDVMIYGTPQNFLFVSPEEIYNYVLKKRKIISTAVHFSCLTYQPQARVLDFDKSKEYMREYMQIK